MLFATNITYQIQTTHGRIHTFGSYILPSLVTSNSYTWILLQQEGCIAGLYYENNKYDEVITRLGVTGDSITGRATPLLPQYQNCDCPSPPIGSPNSGLFLSVAALSDLERVDVCQINNRCTGMLMRYLDGRSVVLGQWHASGFSQSYCIYESPGLSITHIYFRMCKVWKRQIVTDISFSPSTIDATPNSDYQVFSVLEVNCKPTRYMKLAKTFHVAYCLVVLRTLRQNPLLDRRSFTCSNREHKEPAYLVT
jgi:hypothetical protein